MQQARDLPAFIERFQFTWRAEIGEEGLRFLAVAEREDRVIDVGAQRAGLSLLCHCGVVLLR